MKLYYKETRYLDGIALLKQFSFKLFKTKKEYNFGTKNFETKNFETKNIIININYFNLFFLIF